MAFLQWINYKSNSSLNFFELRSLILKNYAKLEFLEFFLPQILGHAIKKKTPILSHGNSCKIDLLTIFADQLSKITSTSRHGTSGM